MKKAAAAALGAGVVLFDYFLGFVCWDQHFNFLWLYITYIPHFQTDPHIFEKKLKGLDVFDVYGKKGNLDII